MKVGHIQDIPGEILSGEGIRGAVKKILLGPPQGWSDHVMRVFELAPGGYTPRHAHDWFHVNYILAGQGTLYLEGTEYPVTAGSYAFVPAGAEHQFRNAGDTPFVFICIVPEKGDRGYMKP